MIPVPANIDIEDRVLWGLTARQALKLAPVAISLLTVWHSLDTLTPTPLLLTGCLIIAGSAATLAVAQRDGVSLDQLMWAAIRHPRTKLAAATPQPDASLAPPRTPRSERVEAWRGPIRAITHDGLDLGDRGTAVALDCVGVNFELRSESEQTALVAGLSRVLHGATDHVQIIQSIRPTSLDGHIQQLSNTSRAIRSSALRQAARAHAAWLTDLCDHTPMVRREITIVVTGPTPDDATRTAANVADGCAAIGVTCQRLDGDALAARIRAHLDPYTPTPPTTPVHDSAAASATPTDDDEEAPA